MYKVVKNREFCECCGSIKHAEIREHFCDSCDRLIDTKDNSKYNMFDITVFSDTQGVKPYDLVFCSWKCLIKKLKTIENDGFITLPYLVYRDLEEGMLAKDFFDLLKGDDE